MKYIKTYEWMDQNINNKLLDGIRLNDDIKILDLLKQGADINCKNDYEWSLLMVAILYDRKEITKKLIELGADINMTQYDGKTPLIIASEINRFDAIQLLIENDADWNIKDAEDMDFLDHISDEYRKYVIEDYPDKYENYLMRKEAKDKYNL